MRKNVTSSAIWEKEGGGGEGGGGEGKVRRERERERREKRGGEQGNVRKMAHKTNILHTCGVFVCVSPAILHIIVCLLLDM